MPEEGGKFNYDFWVCSNCLKPSFLVFKGITHMHYPQRATGLSSIVGHSDGRTILTWHTEVSGEKVKTMAFHAYPRKVDMDQGRDVLVKFWQDLDVVIDGIRDTTHPMGLQALEIEKTRAYTLAEVLAHLMSPFYENREAVLAESMNRWKARQEGKTDHESPGLAERIWDPATRFDGTPYSVEAEKKARTRTAKPKVVLDDQKVTFIKHCLENGSMTAEVLAGMFNCTVDDIKAVVS